MGMSDQLHALFALPSMPTDWKAGGSQTWFGHFGEQKNLFSLQRVKLQTIQLIV